jgi:ribosome-associated protein
MNTVLFVEKLIALLEDKKAEDIVSLHVHDMTTVTDYMIIASCNSGQQVKALANYVHDMAKQNGIEILGVEGTESNEWVLVDLGTVIVHLMQPEIRSYYELEKLWDLKPGG